MYKVVALKKAVKNFQKMPKQEQKKFKLLLEDLKASGPVQPAWPNYSKLSDTEYHCHLSYSWVACWRNEKNSIIVEVYYVGSRENAPY